jgi:large subunit ribosomal protein L4
MNKSVTTKKRTSATAPALPLVTLQEAGVSTPAQRDVSVGFALYIRALLQNWRQGTVACKGRSDVNRSNKKPWKQKGTGRARAGTARSPLWRGGGVTFGPQPRVRTLKVTQQVKHNVLYAMIVNALQSDKVVNIDWRTIEQPKTSVAYTALHQYGLHKNNVLLLLPVDDVVAYASFVNIPNVRIAFFDQVNAFDIAQSEYIVFLQKDMDHFKKMVEQWV